MYYLEVNGRTTDYEDRDEAWAAFQSELAKERGLGMARIVISRDDGAKWDTKNAVWVQPPVQTRPVVPFNF